MTYWRHDWAFANNLKCVNRGKHTKASWETHKYKQTSLAFLKPRWLITQNKKFQTREKMYTFSSWWPASTVRQHPISIVLIWIRGVHSSTQMARSGSDSLFPGWLRRQINRKGIGNAVIISGKQCERRMMASAVIRSETNCFDCSTHKIKGN